MSTLMTVRELAELMGWSEHTVYQRRYRRDSLPPSIKLPNASVRFRREDVEQWLEEHLEPTIGAEGPAPASRRSGPDHAA